MLNLNQNIAVRGKAIRERDTHRHTHTLRKYEHDTLLFWGQRLAPTI